MTDYYRVLEVAKTATSQEIKKAYKRLANKYHPDKNKDANAPTQFNKVKEAYNILSDDLKRKQYDAQFNRSQAEYQFNRNTGGGWQRRGFDNFDAFANDTVRQQNRRSRAKRIYINITLNQSYTGMEYVLDGKKFHIPKGVRPNTTMHVYDTLVTIQIAPHDTFKRAEDDLLCELQLTAIEAMLGMEVLIKTLDNKQLKFKVPQCVQQGQVIKLSGKGMPNPEFDNRVGDLLVRCNISIPKLTKEHLDVIMSLPHRTIIDM